MYVIGYAELTTTALNISALTLETLEALTVLGVVYLTLVWTLSAADPPARVAARAPGGAAERARLGRARRALHPRRGAAGDAARRRRSRVVGSALIGVVLGTLITIHFRPLRALIRLYIEVFRGLPILVTVFIVYFGLPESRPRSSSLR